MTFSVLELFLIGFGCMMVLMAILWAIQRQTNNANSVDFGWTAGIALVAALVALGIRSENPRLYVVLGLAFIWSIRLAGFLFWNRIFRAGEDNRYVRMRAYWGNRAQFHFFWFFQLQAVFVAMFVLPIYIAMSTDRPFGDVFDLLGIAIWLLAVIGESVADQQLSAFKADPANRGRVCDVGLWRYSRHPNYFFEWLHWWTYVAFAVGHPWFFLALLGPVLMIVFLLFVTGIPYSEMQALASRGEAYRRYQERTSAFIPWFPRPERNSKNA